MSALYTIFQMIILCIFFGSIIALFRGYLNLFKVFPIHNRKSAIIYLVICFIIIVILPTNLDEEGSSESKATTETSVKDENSGDDAEKTTPDSSKQNDNEDTQNEASESKAKDKDQTDKTNETAETDSKELEEQQTTEATSNNDSDVESEETIKTTDTSNSQSNDSNKVSATVTRVVDGDTMEVNVDGKEDTVRLLLVDTPETKHPSKPVQKFGPEASQYAKEKLSGAEVKLEYDGPKRDKYDRLLAYMWVDGKMFNQMLLEQGLARYAYVYDPPYTHSKEYMKAQNRAKSQNKGIWSINGYVTSEGFKEQKKTATASSNSSSSSDTSSSNSSSQKSASTGLKYDPNGPDRDCGDFDTHADAQAFFEAAGGPQSDPHRLDGNDKDGIACESLP
ncbi:thermonuclease family protein [Halobacillus rhizosphaerae]|uniref:thermonuclease family protein n=1 Tax=Halobacillus rhizosphaerae TaxID=3064889 RepID=UPI00398B0488